MSPDLKIYLSVDNSSMHRFAYLFILGCLEAGYLDFDFKINKKESINRRDNIVIYCNKKNVGRFIEVVEEIIRQHPEIEFNETHLLGIPYDEHICFGIDPPNGKVSYTENLCQAICKGLDSGISAEEIVKNIERFKEKHRTSLIELVSLTSNNKKK